MIDLTGPVSPVRTHNSRAGIWHEPDARHDLNSLKLHLLIDGSVRSDGSSAGAATRLTAVRPPIWAAAPPTAQPVGSRTSARCPEMSVRRRYGIR